MHFGLDVPNANLALAITADSVIAMLSLALACSALSLIVLWRRWAFLTEGIAHAGFGGAGSAWLLACLFPALDGSGTVMLCVGVFCLATALAIGALQRQENMQSETAIGVFLVAALAWGFLAQQVYANVYHQDPVGFTALLFGHTEVLGRLHAHLALAMSALTLILVGALRKEILACCLEPSLARVSGVRESLVHYLLIILIAFNIVVGVQLVGSVLITALLILPGAAAMLLCRRQGAAIALTLAIGLLGAAGGIALHARWSAVPQGPAVVLSLVVLFMLALAVARARRLRAVA